MVKEKSEGYEVIEFPTKTEPRIKDNETKEFYTVAEAVCKILNEIKEIKKAVG